MEKENKIILSAGDEAELVNTCKQIWKQEKNRGLRYIQKLTKKILIAYKNHLIEKIYDEKESKGEQFTEADRSFIHFNFKNSENDIIEKIKTFFIQKELKKYEGGIDEILKIRNNKRVGIAMVLESDQEFHEKYYEKKVVKPATVVLDINEPLPERGDKEENPKWRELIDEFNKDKYKTAKYIFMMYKSLSLDKYNKEFFERYLEAYCKKLAQRFREEEPKKCEFYELNKGFIERRKKKPVEVFIDKLYQNLGYFKLNFEDFIVNFFTIMKFLTGLKLVLEIEANKKVVINFFCTEKKLKGHAEAFEYDLQIKNYAMRYHKLGRELQKQSYELQGIVKPDNENDKLIDSLKEDAQFNEMDENLQFYFPPYTNYETEKDFKFMRYTKNDAYHVCPNDPELSRMELSSIVATETPEQNCCSNMRSIDRLRLIYRAFDEVIILTKLKNYNFLDSIIILRDYQAYKEILQTENLIWDKANIFNKSKQLDFLHTVRNFYGERIAFYYLFINHYTQWLTFPTLIGIIVFIMFIFKDSLQHVDKNTNMTVMSLVFTVYAMIIVLWATLFLKVWKQKEKLYSYFWGTENFELEEAFDDNFQKDGESILLFKYRLKFQFKYKKVIKYIVSYLIVTVFCLTVIGMLVLLFKWKADTIKRGAQGNLALYIGILNGVQIKVMSIIYSIIANILTKWENHEKSSKFDFHLSLKIVIFEFINNYASLYYIAFFKGSWEGCQYNNNCLAELNMQIYTILLTNFFFNIVELGIPFFMDILNKKAYKNSLPEGKEVDFTPHTIHHQKICEEYSTMRDDYNEMVIQFGYLMFFSVAAPITPFICFILTYIEKFVDSYKMFYLYRVTIIDQANGIGLYNQLFKVWCFIGMTTNIGLVLFTNPELDKKDLLYKFFIFFIIENAILVLTFGLNWNNLPDWFENKAEMTSLYNKNYLSKDFEALPHHDLYEKYAVTNERSLTRSETGQIPV